MSRTVTVAISAALVLVLALPALGGGRPLSAALSPGNEVPPVASNASGSIYMTLNQGQGEICFTFASSGLESAVQAGHIHVGVAGTNGGVAVNLGITAAYDSGCVDADKDTIKAIRQNPAGYYVNIHTEDVPSGELRGQLSK